MPKYAGLAYHSIQAASETWPCTCLPNPTRCLLSCQQELQVCSAAGTAGPSQPRPQQRGTSHGRAMGNHSRTCPPAQAQHALAAQTLAPFSINCYAPKPPKPHLYCPGPPRGWITAARTALASILVAAASGQRQAQGAASSEGTMALVSRRQKLLPPVPSHLLDEVESPVQCGVHLPASGQPWKDRAETAVTLPCSVQPLPSPPAPCCGLGCCTGAECLSKGSAARRLAMLGVTPRPHFTRRQLQRRSPLQEAALEKGRSAWAGSRGTIMTLVGCHVLPWSALIHSKCIFKAARVPSPSVTGLRHYREPLCGRGLLKAPPRTSLQLETLCPRDAALPRASFKVPQLSPAARQLLLAQLFRVSIAFLEDFTPHLQILVGVWGWQRANRETWELSLTGAGEVPALDGVACARVHPARGLGLIAAKDKERGCQQLRGPREPLPIAGEGSLQHE